MSYTDDLKYSPKGTPLCPKCEHIMMSEGQVGACAPRLLCICGNSIFKWQGSPKPDFDLLQSMTRTL